MQLKVSRQPNGAVSIEAKLSSEEVQVAKTKALNKLSKFVSIPGFRQGKAPSQLAEGHIKLEKLAEETFSDLAAHGYEDALDQEKLLPITKPHVHFAKEELSTQPIEKTWTEVLQDGATFTIETFVTPDIDLGQWEKIVQSVKQPKPKSTIETATSLSDAKTKVKSEPSKDEPAGSEPLLTDLIIEALVDQIKFPVPDELVDGEAQQLVFHQAQIVQQLGISYEDYLKTQKKTVEEVIKEVRPEGEKNLRVRFILSEIARVNEDKLGTEATVQNVLDFLTKIHDETHSKELTEKDPKDKPKTAPKKQAAKS